MRPVACSFILFAALGAAACSSSSPSGAAQNDAGGPLPEAGTSSDGGGDAGADVVACTPATGYELAAAKAANATANQAHLATVIDGGGNPMVAWVEYEKDDPKLYFAAYDRATCKWKAPVIVDHPGDLDNTRDREVTLARDASNGHLAIGYQILGTDGSTKVNLAQSDDGVTWALETVASNPADQDKSVSRPTVALSGGKTFFVYYRHLLYPDGGGSSQTDNSGFILATRTGTSGAFGETNVPKAADATLLGAEGFPPSIAVDGNGTPGVVYLARTADTGENLRVVYWHAGDTDAHGVFDSEDTQNDESDVSLAYEGTKPRVAASLARGTDDGSKIWFATSDDGVTWAAPTELPMDGGDGMGPDLSLAFDGKGNATVAARYGGGNGVHTCGPPKIATSSNDGQTWSTCGPVKDPMISYAGNYVNIAYAPNGKRVAGFVASDTGVYVWREP